MQSAMTRTYADCSIHAIRDDQKLRGLQYRPAIRYNQLADILPAGYRLLLYAVCSIHAIRDDQNLRGLHYRCKDRLGKLLT